MDINRHNYETFFLLYIDGELAQSDRLKVETFVEQNPDLAGELMQLESTVMMPDQDAFIDKSLLFKDDSIVNINNYEEHFLSLIDGELNAVDTEAFNKFLQEHPAMQPELDILKQTIVQPEKIVFDDKKLLYRSEAKIRKFGAYPWFRIAAAAAIITIVASLWVTKLGDDEIAPLIAVTDNKSKEVQINTPSTKNNNEVNITEENAPQEPAVIATKKSGINNHPRPLLKEMIKDVNVAVENHNRNNLPTPESNPVLAKNKKLEELREARIDVVLPLKGDNDIVSAKVVDDPSIATENMVRNTVYREVKNPEQETIFIAGAEINKNKLKGLFKKATTLLEKRFKKNDGENIVEIASFKINTN